MFESPVSNNSIPQSNTFKMVQVESFDEVEMPHLPEEHLNLEDDVIQVDSSDEADLCCWKQSIIKWIEQSEGSGKLKRLLKMCNDPIQVNEIPSVYNGTICFELPATFGKQKRMYGMEQKFDGHFWTRPA